MTFSQIVQSKTTKISSQNSQEIRGGQNEIIITETSSL